MIFLINSSNQDQSRTLTQWIRIHQYKYIIDADYGLKSLKEEMKSIESMKSSMMNDCSKHEYNALR